MLHDAIAKIVSTRAAGVPVTQTETRAVSAPTMRQSNALHLLSTLRDQQLVSRTELARRTGLTIPTVHRLIAALVQAGLVVPDEATPYATANGSGRRPSWYRFNGQAASIAAVDVGNETTRAALAMANGQVIQTRSVSTSAIADSLVSGLTALVSDMKTVVGAAAGPLVGLTVGVSATVDPGTGSIVRAATYRGWDEVPLRDMLRQHLACPVEVEQDDHLAALAELSDLGAARGASSVVVVNLGKGIGAGYAHEGRMLRGTHGAAGRLAQWPLRGAANCTVGDVLVADALLRSYAERGGCPTVGNGAALCAAARAGDRHAQAVIDEAAEVLGDVFMRLATAFDPAVMVLGGGFALSFDLFAPAITRSLADLPYHAMVVPSALGSDAVVTGGLLAAMEYVEVWLEEQLRTA